MLNFGEKPKIAAASSTSTWLLPPSYSVLNMNLISLVTGPLTYSRTLSSAKASVLSPVSGSVWTNDVRTPAPIVIGGAEVCALEEAATSSAQHVDARRAAVPRRCAVNGALQTRSVSMGSSL